MKTRILRLYAHDIEEAKRKALEKYPGAILGASTIIGKYFEIVIEPG